MKRKNRPVLAVLLVISVLLPLLGIFSGTAAAADPQYGSTGELNWKLEDGTLTIDGKGTPAAFASQTDQPWAAVRNQIFHVIISDSPDFEPGNIAYWFSGCRNLVSAEIPGSVEVIGYRAFYNCSSLSNMVLYHTKAPEIEQGAFLVNKPAVEHAHGYEPFLHIDCQNTDVLAALCRYDWFTDGCIMTVECPAPASKGGMLKAPSSGTRAAGTCTECGETCSYTLGYEYWDEREHTIRHWCSNCGQDQYGGVMWEDHTFRNGVCTKCGYNTNCSHPSVSRTWSGCLWYDKCDICGTILNQGSEHNFSYGEYEYYSEERHRQLATCRRCGLTEYHYTFHDESMTISPYSETQHRIYYLCDLCSHEVGGSELENHRFSNSSWTDYSESEHRRQKTCSICGYSTYKYEPHYDSNSDGICDDCGRQLYVRFSVTVPASLAIAVSERGEVFTSENARITNGSAAAVKVTAVSVAGENGWTLVPFDEPMADKKVDSMLVGFRINGASSGAVGNDNTADLVINEEEWNIQPGGYLPLTYDAVISATSVPVPEVQIMTVYFVVSWAS